MQSKATALQKMFYNHDKPYTKKIKFFNVFKPMNMVEKPLAYIIPQGWYEVIERMKLNGVIVKQFTRDTMMDVNIYHIDDYKSQVRPIEKHHKNYAVKTSFTNQRIPLLKGDFIINLDQPANRYIVETLEPTAEDGFFAWNFFDAILQQKEGYSDYRWDEVAAVILEKDMALRQKLEAKKASDPAFATNASAILEFIYKNSPYYEKAHLRYPVYRLEKN